MMPAPLILTYRLTSAGNIMHSLDRKSSLVGRKGFMKAAPGAGIMKRRRVCSPAVLYYSGLFSVIYYRRHSVGVDYDSLIRQTQFVR